MIIEPDPAEAISATVEFSGSAVAVQFMRADGVQLAPMWCESVDLAGELLRELLPAWATLEFVAAVADADFADGSWAQGPGPGRALH